MAYYASNFAEIINEELKGVIRVGTGIISGGVLTVNANTTKFDVSAGSGIHVDLDTNEQIAVTWSSKIAQTPTYLNTHLISWVAIDKYGALYQKSSPFTSEENRDYIILGVLVHVNKTNLDAVNNQQKPTDHITNQFHDLTDALGTLNLIGNEFSPYATDLQMKKSVGTLFKTGSNYYNDTHNPHVLTLSSLNPLVMQYRLADGNNHTGLTQTTVIPTLYESSAGVTSAVGASAPFTIQRIFIFTSNNIKLQFGQSTYKTMPDAVAAIATEVFITEPSILANGLLRGYLIISKDCTNLADSTLATFFHVGKFGGSASSGSVGGVTTLQQAYVNSGASTQITTDATGGSFKIQGGVSNTNTIIEGLNLAGTSTTSITGEGVIGCVSLDVQTGLYYDPGLTPTLAAIELTGIMTRNISTGGGRAAIGHRIDSIEATGANYASAGSYITNITCNGNSHGIYINEVESTTASGRDAYGIRIENVSVSSVTGSGQNVYGVYVNGLSTTTGTSYGLHVTADTNYLSGSMTMGGSLILPDGALNGPAISFSNSSGIYLDTSDRLNICAASNRRIICDDGDNIYLLTGTGNATTRVQITNTTSLFSVSVLIPSGVVTSPGLAFSSQTNTGIYKFGTSLCIAANGILGLTVASSSIGVGQNMIPDKLNSYTLGNSTYRFDHLHTNGITNYSDMRLKDNVENLTLSLSFINSLQPKKYTMKEDDGIIHSRQHIGLIAQEVADSLYSHGVNLDQSDIVNNDFLKRENIHETSAYLNEKRADDDIYGINYISLIPCLINAIKELTNKVNALELQIDTLKNSHV